MNTTIFFPASMPYPKMMRWLGERYLAYTIVQWSGVVPNRVGIAIASHYENRQYRHTIPDSADAVLMASRRITPQDIGRGNEYGRLKVN